MTRFSFCMIRFLLYVLFYVHGFYVRIILGTMKVVRKEFDAVIMINFATIFIFITVLFSLFLLLS